MGVQTLNQAGEARRLSAEGGRVEGPIAPGRSGEAVLEKHADDGHHGQASVRQL
eukprot:CAMPEP_0177198708 /NCGR_PEP_ID=MMETSP0367-20130122/25274_1 /TAXON_ID=447022 ORGANISM="Scrippsiella hangoei-like, Strain SHHI-4" /NCGR_SAMPLE_ID=MMETSP0367 /ASSEMBLY_ACC=CAM_ASM_000362 /LENGTH=53 /DNA_ID=CAMNT_0018646987 /DNA_START=72 /DNA_END=230 /DNA_ORIENTATION=-